MDQTLQTHLARLKRIAELTEVERFSFAGQRRAARVVRVVDGDTLDVAMIVDNVPQRFRLRLANIDTPELRPPRDHAQRDDIRREALAAKRRMEELCPIGHCVIIDCGSFDMFGRVLANSVQTKKNGENICDTMVKEGFAVVISDGRRCRDWQHMWSQLCDARNDGNDGSTDSEREMRDRQLNATPQRQTAWWRRLKKWMFKR